MAIATDLERYMLDLLNMEREERGLNSLVLEQNLNASADAHTEWMIESDVFSHTGKGDSGSTDRMRASGYDLVPSWGTAENLALLSADAGDGLRDEVLQAHKNLMASPTHRPNILNSKMEHVGIGIEVGEYEGHTVLMVTQNFGYTAGDADLDTGTASVLRGNSSDDTIIAGSGPDTINGGFGHDTIRAGAGEDVVRGGYGRDDVRLGGGDDIFIDNGQGGRLGFDTISGQRGDDEIRGGGGNDLISGNLGHDTLEGGSGNDTIKGFFGDDVIDGGSGHDKIFAGSNDDVVEGGFGRDKVYMGAGRDVYIDNGQGGFNGADNVRGGTGGDEIRGGGGNDQFRGGGGNDTVSGGDGDDLVVGHHGSDVLSGNAGNDTLYGNFGRDTFVFSKDDDVDRVMDYATGWDRLSLDADLLGGMEVEQFLTRNADVTGDSTTIDFGNGDRLILEGTSDLSALVDDVTLF